MTCEESIKWLDSLIKTLGQSQYQSLWNWEQPLTEIKEMLESKRVIELPDIKENQAMYIIYNNKIKRLNYQSYSVKNGILSVWLYKNGFNWSCKVSEIGKTVFLTKSEAEQKLKELLGDN